MVSRAVWGVALPRKNQVVESRIQEMNYHVDKERVWNVKSEASAASEGRSGFNTRKKIRGKTYLLRKNIYHSNSLFHNTLHKNSCFCNQQTLCNWS